MNLEREDLEKDLVFVCFIIMENKLKPITTKEIDVLRNASIRCVMVTGDNILTATYIAKQCNLID